MAVLRRPVSQRRQARRRDSIKVRGPASKSSKYSTFKRINTSQVPTPRTWWFIAVLVFLISSRTRLVWNQAIALTRFSSAITQVYSVRMNGPFDPQAALGGTQPQYYDMLASMYSSYLVKGAKISVTFSPTTSGTAGDGPYVVGIKCGRATGVVTNNVSLIAQTSNTGHTVMSPNGGSTTITQTYSPKQLEPDGEGDDIQAQTSGTPTRQWYANVFASPLGTSVARQC